MGTTGQDKHCQALIGDLFLGNLFRGNKALLLFGRSQASWCIMCAVMNLQTPLLTRRQAAEALGISLRSLDSLLATGDLPIVRIGASVRLRPSAIEYFCEARETRNNPRKTRRP